MNQKVTLRQWLREFKQDQVFMKTLMAIAVPIMVQNLISSSLNMIDTLMIGQVGQVEIAAVGLANQLFLLIMLGLTGICAGTGIFISQYWGKKDLLQIKKFLGFSLIIGVTYALLITFLVQSFPKQIIGWFNKESNVVGLGCDYLVIVSISYVFTAITFAYSYALRSIERTKIPMIVSAIAVLVNVIGNAIFIFGVGPVPAMGVKGAALATVIARIVEAVSIVAIVYLRKTPLAANLREIFVIPKHVMLSCITPILAITGNELCWGLGTIIYTKAYGHIGSDALASIQIVNTITNFFLVAIFAMAAASFTIVGNTIGAGEEERAILYAKRIAFLCIAGGILLSVILIFAAPLVVTFFNVSEGVGQMTVNLLIINSVILVIRIYNILMIVGIFRGGGDTKYSLYVEAGTMWGIGVPLSLIGVYVFNLRLEFVVSLLMIEEIVKCMLCIIRFKSHKWIHNVVN
ncbi:MAG: MATE family efflux transporter [Cellulosilyticaceae bacterium]